MGMAVWCGPRALAQTPTLRPDIARELARGLAAITDLEVTDRQFNYVLSVVVVPTNLDTYVVSFTVMSVYDAVALHNVSLGWEMTEISRERFKAAFVGTGVLVDQRAQVGSNLRDLSDDIVRAIDADILGPRRQRRAP
jgi:hypothetical protein